MTRYRRRLLVALLLAFSVHAAWLTWQPAERLEPTPLQVRLRPTTPARPAATARHPADAPPRARPAAPVTAATRRSTAPAPVATARSVQAPAAPSPPTTLRETTPPTPADPMSPGGTVSLPAGDAAPATETTTETSAAHPTTPAAGRNVPPRLRVEVPVEFPRVSAEVDEQVVVQLALDIDEAGNVQAARVQRGSGYPQLDRAARQGILRYKFWPAERNGQPVGSALIYRYRINLKDTGW